MKTAAEPFRDGFTASGVRVSFYRTAQGRVLRLKRPGPPPHEGCLEVFEDKKPVCRVDSDMRVLQFLIDLWVINN